MVRGRLPVTGVYDYLGESIDLMFEGGSDIKDADAHDASEVVALGGNGAG